MSDDLLATRIRLKRGLLKRMTPGYCTKKWRKVHKKKEAYIILSNDHKTYPWLLTLTNPDKIQVKRGKEVFLIYSFRFTH